MDEDRIMDDRGPTIQLAVAVALMLLAAPFVLVWVKITEVFDGILGNKS